MFLLKNKKKKERAGREIFSLIERVTYTDEAGRIFLYLRPLKNS